MTDNNQRLATVITVDNHEDELCLLRSILQLKGFDVLEAENGREAIDLATRWTAGPHSDRIEVADY